MAEAKDEVPEEEEPPLTDCGLGKAVGLGNHIVDDVLGSSASDTWDRFTEARWQGIEPRKHAKSKKPDVKGPVFRGHISMKCPG